MKHYRAEPLSTVESVLQDSDLQIQTINLEEAPEARLSADGLDGLVVLGGPMNADDVKNFPYLAREVVLIREMLAQQQPVLGICLGAQLLCNALGGKVSADSVHEVGWHDVSTNAAGQADPLLSRFNGSEELFHWHYDECLLPSGPITLASSELSPIQAFREGNAYGLQFHMEVTRGMVESWLRDMEADCKKNGKPFDVKADAILSRAKTAMEPMNGKWSENPFRLNELARDVFGRWAAQFLI